MEGPQPGKIQFGADEEQNGGGHVPKSGRLENAAPTFLVDAWYLGKLKVLFSSTNTQNTILMTKLVYCLSEQLLNPKWTKAFGNCKLQAVLWLSVACNVIPELQIVCNNPVYIFETLSVALCELEVTLNIGCTDAKILQSQMFKLNLC